MKIERPGPKRTLPKRRPDADKKITDHAVLRYIERVMGMDVEGVRRTMLTAEQRAWVQRVQTGSFPIGDGHVAKVVNGVVVTIV